MLSYDTQGNSRYYSKNGETVARGLGSAGAGWIEPFAKPMRAVWNVMGIASLHPSYALRAATQNPVIPRACGVSSTPRLLDSITGVSGILDRPVKPGDDTGECGAMVPINC